MAAAATKWPAGLRAAARGARRNAIFREAGVYLGGFVGVALVRFLAVPVFARALGPVDYSDLALVLATTTGLATITTIGGDTALSRFWFRESDDEGRRDLTVTWLGFLTVWSVVVVGALLLAMQATGWMADRPELRAALVIGLVGMVPTQAGRMLAQVLRNRFEPVKYSLMTAGTAAVGVVLGIVAVLGLGLGVSGAVLGVLVAETLGALVVLFLVRAQLHGRPRPHLLPRLLRFAVPLVPAALATWVFVGADRIAVDRYLGAGALGPYSVATTLVLPISMLMYAMGQAWLPRVTALYESDPEAGAALTANGLQLAIYGYGLVAVALALVSPWLVVTVAGEDFAAGAAAVPLLAIGAALWGTTMFTSTGYVLARRTGLATLVPIAAAALTIVLLVLLLPRVGIVGAAAAVAAGYLALTSGLLAVSLRYLPIPVPWLRLAAALTALAANAAVATRMPGTAAAAASAAGTAAVLAALILASYRHRF